MEDPYAESPSAGCRSFLVSLRQGSTGPTSQSAPGNQDRSVQEQQIADWPLFNRTFRPKLSLQAALKIAESYVDKHDIDISSYWLYSGNYTLYGDRSAPDKDKIPVWYFWWVKNTGAMGDYVEIFVDMDGKAWRVPSM